MGGASSGAGGGVGPAGRKTDGTYGTVKDARRASRRNEVRSAVKKTAKFIATGGVTGAVLRSIAGNKDKKKTYDRASALGNRSSGNEKSDEQPRVASQMDNTAVKSSSITADKTAPTSIEMNEDEDIIKRKRGRRTKTVLTSVTGDTSKPILSKKTLLGA